jgi:hypothetical protein
MLYKARKESTELLTLRFLNRRMELEEKDRQYYLNLEKGFEGERQFDKYTEKLKCDCLVLNDLRLSVTNTTFQIDALVITDETAFLFEVKNHEGDFYLDRDRIYYRKNKSEVSNPLIQLQRCESLFRQLIHSLGLSLSVTAFVVFIHPEFTLYQAPLNLPILFPTQLNRFFKELNTLPSKLSGKHKKLADKLLSLHMEKTPYTKLPTYKFEQLRKGIICTACGAFACNAEGRHIVCRNCGQEEDIYSAIFRTIQEFRLLFPEQKMTTAMMKEWCKIIESNSSIRKVLEDHFKTVGKRRWAYYC